MYKVAGFFAGVGGIELGFKQAGFDVVWANDFNEKAAETYRLNHTHHLEVRDIKEVKGEDIPDVDIITGGFPCQAFSISGYKKGFEDERGMMFFEILRLIIEKQPKAILLENVKNLVAHDSGNTYKVIMEALRENGYYVTGKVLNGSVHGNTPQNRERIYIVGFKDEEALNRFEFPDAIPLEKGLDDVIDFNEKQDERFYYRENKCKFYEELEKEIIRQDRVYQWRRKYVRENKSGVCPTLTANMGTGGHNVPLILSNHGIRKLTPQECFNIQGFPKDFQMPEGMANSHLYQQAGNSVVVPVIKRIAEKMKEAMES